MNELKREVTFGLHEKYNEGDIMIFFKLIGKAGVIALETRVSFLEIAKFTPRAMVIGRHSFLPKYVDEEPMDSCDFLGGKPCYYDGSGLQAEELIEEFCKTGDEEIIWKKLEEFYEHHMGNLDVGDPGI